MVVEEVESSPDGRHLRALHNWPWIPGEVALQHGAMMGRLDAFDARKELAGTAMLEAADPIAAWRRS